MSQDSNGLTWTRKRWSEVGAWGKNVASINLRSDFRAGTPLFILGKVAGIVGGKLAMDNIDLS